MSLELLVQGIVSGLLVGGVFAVVAVSLSLVFGVLNVVNFAHGEFVMMGMFGTYFLQQLFGIDPYASAAIVGPAMFVVGLIIYQFVIAPSLRGAHSIQILLTVGLSIFLANFTQYLVGPQYRTLNTSYTNMAVEIGGISINAAKGIAFGVALALVGLIYLFLQFTKTGKCIRASSQDREGAALLGIDVARTQRIAFAIGAAGAGVAGSIIIPFFYVTASVGLVFVLTAFIVVVIGGMGSLWGALVGALVIGVIESLTEIFYSPSVKQIGSLVLFLLVLYLRPEGLFGRKVERY